MNQSKANAWFASQLLTVDLGMFVMRTNLFTFYMFRCPWLMNTCRCYLASTRKAVSFFCITVCNFLAFGIDTVNYTQDRWNVVIMETPFCICLVNSIMNRLLLHKHASGVNISEYKMSAQQQAERLMVASHEMSYATDIVGTPNLVHLRTPNSCRMTSIAVE